MAEGVVDEEVEITPEMLAAGLSEFLGYDSRFEMPEDVVQRIFLAMCAHAGPDLISIFATVPTAFIATEEPAD